MIPPASSLPCEVRARSRAAGGFTLVEVLVALAIVTLGMAALLTALGSSADSISYLRDKTLAEWVALNRLAEVRLAVQRPTKGKTEGETEMAGEKWKWAQEVTETEIKGILRIDVSARPASAPGGPKAQWYTTVSGIVGDALALPRGDMDPYGLPMQNAGPGPVRNPPNGTPNDSNSARDDDGSPTAPGTPRSSPKPSPITRPTN